MSATFRVALAGQTVPFRFSTVNFAGIRELVAADVEQDINARAAKAQNGADFADKEAVTQNLLFLQSGTGAASRTVRSKLREIVSPLDFGAVGDGTTDDTDAVQAAFDTGKTVDGAGLTYKVTSSVEQLANTRVRNITLKAGVAGLDMHLVNSGCRVQAKYVGSGVTNVIERAIYPAADGVTDVELDIDVQDITVGVQGHYLTSNDPANNARRWHGKITARNILGDPGESFGYALLLAGSQECDFVVIAKDVARHAAYLSAGASRNRVHVTVDGCLNNAVQIYSLTDGSQPPSESNYIEVRATNLGENVAGQSGAFAIVGLSNDNTIVCHDTASGEAARWGIVQGANGVQPRNNKIIGGSTRLADGLTGASYTGTDVLVLENEENTLVSGNSLIGYAGNFGIAIRKVGTNTAEEGAYVVDNVIDCLGQNRAGIYTQLTGIPHYIGPNRIRNTGTALRVRDDSSGARTGWSRTATFEGTTASVTAGASADVEVELSQPIQTTSKQHVANIVSAASSLGVVLDARITARADEDHATMRVYNGAGSDQTLNYAGFINGD